MLRSRMTTDPRAATMMAGGAHWRGYPQQVGQQWSSPPSADPRAGRWQGYTVRQNAAGGAWMRTYGGRDAGIQIEKFSDVGHAQAVRTQPQYAGIQTKGLRMDKNQTREVRGHEEGQWGIVHKKSHEPWLGKHGTDKLSATRPPPVSATQRENRMFRNLIEREQWQTVDRARGRLGGMRIKPATGAAARVPEGMPAFWRTMATQPFSVGDAVQQARTPRGRQLAARRSATIERAAMMNILRCDAVAATAAATAATPHSWCVQGSHVTPCH
eukprot:COSAG01_NODE_1880_length_8993_cov_60.775916_8_plen_270_part_00